MPPSLASLPAYIAFAVVANGLTFVLAGGGLHYAYYVRRADRAATWRIQSDKPLPTLDEMREKLRRVLPNIFLFNAFVGVALWAIANGYSQVVFDTERYGALTLVLTALASPVVFHVLAFIIHRAYHTPLLYKLIHYEHHRTRTPTFIDGLAMHKFEVFTSALALVAPAFLMPMHIVAFGVYLTAVGIHELLDHSGIHLRIWPMSPSEHHDEHHRVVRRCYAQTFSWLDDAFDSGMPKH